MKADNIHLARSSLVDKRQNPIKFKPGDRAIIAPAHLSIYRSFLYRTWQTAKRLIYSQSTVQSLYNYYRHQTIM
ncbi:hypothetical protein V1478_008360 [Vespula squamosa]|uniref:Uncharacterized protein n=1 Tax=Vespula squamosa TaxID=30214 RepID=A0ABD2AU21_VESSQ